MYSLCRIWHPQVVNRHWFLPLSPFHEPPLPCFPMKASSLLRLGGRLSSSQSLPSSLKIVRYFIVSERRGEATAGGQLWRVLSHGLKPGCAKLGDPRQELHLLGTSFPLEH